MAPGGTNVPVMKKYEGRSAKSGSANGCFNHLKQVIRSYFIWKLPSMVNEVVVAKSIILFLIKPLISFRRHVSVVGDKINC